MANKEIIPYLFRIEYQKMISVLSHLFGIQYIEIAEDIVSETFLAATESWPINGVPEYPEAWLYTTAKNKARNYFKHTTIFDKKIAPELSYFLSNLTEEMEIDLSKKNIADSQLAMIFTICNPINPNEAQIALALNLLCGFGVTEIADAFITNKEVIYKRIHRAKEKLKKANIKIESPSRLEITRRMDNALKTIYLLFSEGYYSSTQNTILRKEFCMEAMRLTNLLIQNEITNLPQTNALLSLMCFHVSRFDARINAHGDIVLYQDQDVSLWNQELIARGGFFLKKAATGEQLSKYHLEAGIAFWHTQKEDTIEKWEHILELYNNLLILDYSSVVALNRCYAFSKVNGKLIAIKETEKLNLTKNHFYFSLLGNLYTDIDKTKAIENYSRAFQLAKTSNEQNIINKALHNLRKNKI